MSARLLQRIKELRAADNLAVVFELPQARCHQLTGDRAGQFAVDVKHPYRLVFEPANEPVPKKHDGGIDLSGVTEITVIEVVDYHGHS